MKKLLVLMLVLGMASAANAGIVSLSGLTDLPYDGTITLTVSYSGTPDIVSWDIYVTSGDSAKAELRNVVIDSMPNRNTQYDYIGAITDGYEVSASSDAAALGTTWMTVDLAGSGNETDISSVVTISLANVLIYDTAWGYTYPTMGSHEVTIVPEPTTIALLGLGGLLFLRRRR